MKTSSRLSRIAPVLVVAALALPFIAFAAAIGGNAVDNVTPVANSVLATVQVLVTVVFTLSIVAFGWGIVQFIFAGGDPAGIAKAKAFLLWGVIGMAVMASIFGLIGFLRTYFGVAGGGLTVNQPTVQ